MIQKLFNLKKLQIEQQILIKAQYNSKISDLREIITTMQYEITTKSVDKTGAIRDFYVLEMHKKNLKDEIRKMSLEITKYNGEIQKIDKIIVELSKEKEQFNYILQQQKEEKFRQELKAMEAQSSEFIQYRYINNG